MPTLRKRSRPDDDTLRWAAAVVATHTGSLALGGLRIKIKRLDDDTAAELVGLTKKATSGGGFNLTLLSERERRTWENAVEAGVGRERDSVFEQGRREAATQKELRDILRDVRRPSRRVALEEPGSVTLSRESVFDDLRDGALCVSHLGTLVYLQAIWENGGIPVGSDALSYDGETITVDFRRGGLVPDLIVDFCDEENQLDHLVAHGFIEIEKRGRVWRITQGPRLKAVRRAAA